MGRMGASHSFCFKYLSINCRLHLDREIGVVRSVTYDSLIFILMLFVGINEDLGEVETKIFLNFLIAVEFLLLTVCLIFWDID